MRITLGVYLLALAAAPTVAEDWPQFLGPNRNGVSAETGLIGAWPADGPKVLWRAPLGVSMSGIAVVGDRLYTMFQDDAQQYAVCLDVNLGDELWRTPLAPLYKNGMGNGPRATPVVAGEQIVCFTGEGILAALNRADGKQAWSVDVSGSLSGKPAEYGVSCSPIIVNDLVIVNTGAESAATAAFRLTDGKLVWKSGRGKSGYSSPMLMEFAGVMQVVTFTAAGVSGLDPASGKVFWAYEFPTEYDCNTASPVRVGSDSVLISAGEDHGAVVLKLSHSSDKWTAMCLSKDGKVATEMRINSITA